MSDALTYALYPAVFLLLFGDRLFGALNARFSIEPPAFYTFVMSFEDIRNSKMFTALGLFFLASVVSGNMQKTGAFEVWHNSVEFFSRKKTGGIPDMAVIVASLGDAIKVAKLAAASAKSMGLDNI